MPIPTDDDWNLCCFPPRERGPAASVTPKGAFAFSVLDPAGRIPFLAAYLGGGASPPAGESPAQTHPLDDVGTD
ncbi:hypothetical protein OHB54_44835 [Streptomyces sp. NBC_01007]|nr:hypothetical protein OHB54_44835 [Streptomyces sp. NBC_01007]